MNELNARPGKRHVSEHYQSTINTIVFYKNFVPFLIDHCTLSTSFRLAHEEYRYQTSIELFKAMVKKVLTENVNKIDNLFTFKVKVLLDEKECSEGSLWTLFSGNGFIIFNDAGSTKETIIQDQALTLSVHRGKIWIHNKLFVDQGVIIYPRKGFIRLKENFYQGFFRIVKQGRRVYLINQLDLEDYIYSVLRWESWPGWPIEVNKAFAIAIRSYLVSKVMNAQKKNQCFHIKNTNIHQTYNGVHEYTNLKRAIVETQGRVLTFNKRPVEAMFDSCCGGIIPAKLSNVNFSKAPYLARTYPCTYCKTCKIYSWQVNYSLDDMNALLHDAGYKIGTIRDIKITQKDAAGAINMVTIKGSYKTIALTGKRMYSLFAKIKSCCYSIEKKGKSIVFNGQGYGHHLGICQWGAKNMVDAGWNYTSILEFYYPGTVIMQLKNSTTT